VSDANHRAVPLLERARANLAAGPSGEALADVLVTLGVVLTQATRYGEAERRLGEARLLREQADNRNTPGSARTWHALGVLYRWTGRYDDALAALDRAAEIQASFPDDDFASALTLMTRGDVQRLRGDPFVAQETWRTALAVLRRIRPDHPLQALILRRLGSAAFAVGDVPAARALRQQALDIGSAELPPCHPESHGFTNDRANSALYEGDYELARRLYLAKQTQMDACRRSSAADVPEDGYATLAFNQGDLARLMGEYQSAIAFSDRARRIWSRVLGAGHPFVALALDNLAASHEAQGQVTRARDLQQQALAIRQKALGPLHPDVAWTLVSIAGNAAASRQAATATKYLQDALAIYRRAGAAVQPEGYTRALDLQGTLAMQQGDYASARDSFTRGFAARERVFGAEHPLAAESLARLALADFALGSGEQALRAALRAEEVGREHLRFTVSYLPERQALTYAEKRPRGLDIALSVASDGLAVDGAMLFDAATRSRGVLLDEFVARARAGSQSEPALTALSAALTGARQRFANLMFRSLQGQEPVAPALLERARKEKEDAERALAERSAPLQAELARAKVGLDEVRRQLPEGAALVSFVRYDRTSFSKGQSGATTEVTPSYMAFVLPARDGSVRTIPLGPAASLEKMVENWRREARGGSLGLGAARADSAYRRAAVELRRSVWDKLAAHTVGATQIFIVPDGALNLVNFAALPSDDGAYLVEGAPVIHYLSAERDVVPSGPLNGGRGVMAVGGPAFDTQPAQAPAVVTRRSGCTTRAALRFTNLPGTLAEARDITAMWPDASDVELLTGSGATESAVKRSLAGRRIVHLATHGFFLGADCDTGPANTRAVGGIVGAPGRATVAVDNPLLLSGLALAGANRRTGALASQDDGILTAEEVAGLNLQGTEWAVLSACDTGVGTIRAGEGVFGLRRAFQIAGARTVIMSLWSVEDQATRAWMRSLYEGRLKAGLSTAAAVRSASLSVLRDRRARGQSTHPFYWAAFVAVGDWQ